MAYIIFDSKKVPNKVKARILDWHKRRKWLNWFLLGVIVAETSYIIWTQIN